MNSFLRASLFIGGAIISLINPVYATGFLCTLVFSEMKFAEILDNNENNIRVSKKTDEEIIGEMDRIDTFSCKTDYFYYLAFIDYVFAKKRDKSLFPEIFKAITTENISYFYIPKNGIMYFTFENEKIYFKIINNQKITYQQFSVYIKPGTSSKYLNTIKPTIKNNLQSFLDNNEKNVSIILENFEFEWLPRFAYWKKEVPKEINLVCQNYVINYINDNLEKIKKNKISRFFLFGGNFKGKTHTCTELSKKIKKPLYILKETSTKEEFIYVLKQIPSDVILDVSDLGWIFYDPSKGMTINQNSCSTIEDIQRLIIDRKDIFILFSSNKTFNFLYENTGFIDHMQFKIDFDSFV